MKVIVQYDVEGWAYHKRAVALQKYAPPEIEVVICSHKATPWTDVADGKFNLAYVLDYTQAGDWKRKTKSNCRIPIVVSFNKDANSRLDDWKTTLRHADFTVVNNEHRWKSGRIEDCTCCISNGVDLDTYRYVTPIAERPHRVLWTGSSGPAKMKGYQEVIQPLQPMLDAEGFSCDFRPINHIDESVYSSERMVDWYNGGSYVLCSSASEGTPNIALEGPACGCVLVSTWIANVQEFGRDRGNCVISRRDAESFLCALRYARENRERLSAAGRETMQGWGYAGENGRAQYYYQLWRRIVFDGVGSVSPFSYRDTDWRMV